MSKYWQEETRAAIGLFVISIIIALVVCCSATGQEWHEESSVQLPTTSAISSTTYGIAIGEDSFVSPKAGHEGISIGRNSISDVKNSVVINGIASTDYAYPNSKAGGLYSVAISGVSGGWRAVSVGGWARAVSSTAYGAGSVADNTHSIAIGRGAWAPGKGQFPIPLPKVVIGAAQNSTFDVYFSNTWRNMGDSPHPIGIGNTIDTSQHSVRLHGWDAFDTDGIVGNQNAGHLELWGGIGTDAGQGGEVRIMTAPANPLRTAFNWKNPGEAAAKFDAAESTTGVDTRFLLLDVQDNELKRVKLGYSTSFSLEFPFFTTRKYLYVDD